MSAFDPSRLDRVLHEPVRLTVASVLASRRDATFTELRELLGLTDGNLSVHLRALEDAGYVTITKEFVERRPRTTVQLSRKGRGALSRHLDALEEIVKQARGGAPEPAATPDAKHEGATTPDRGGSSRKR